MKRTLRLRRDVLTELTESELGALVGAEQATRPACFEVRTLPLYSCLFICTEV